MPSQAPTELVPTGETHSQSLTNLSVHDKTPADESSGSVSHEQEVAISSTNTDEDKQREHDGPDLEKAGNLGTDNIMDDKPFSIFTHNEKRIIIICAGVCSFFSPVSGQIYFPSLNVISADLHVSYDLVNLTITTYMVRTSTPTW